MGSARQGGLDHRLRERWSRICGDRGAALGHLGGRRAGQPRKRPALAGDQAVAQGLRGAPCARLLELSGSSPLSFAGLVRDGLGRDLWVVTPLGCCPPAASTPRLVVPRDRLCDWLAPRREPRFRRPLPARARRDHATRTPEERRRTIRAGARAAAPLAGARGIVGVSFGVVAEPVIGDAAAVVMSVFVFAGSAQFASNAVLGAGGSVSAAIAAAILLNLRYVPMGIALAPSLRGRALKRGAYGQAMVDSSWAMASTGDGRFDPDFMLGATLPQYPAWVLGTVAGILAGGRARHRRERRRPGRPLAGRRGPRRRASRDRGGSGWLRHGSSWGHWS